jgi:hypothetical protein
VTFIDYMKVKKELFRNDHGRLWSPDEELEEKRRFHLIDTDNSGTVAWSEFINYEAAQLLIRKNKVNNNLLFFFWYNIIKLLIILFVDFLINLLFLILSIYLYCILD